MPKLSTKPHLSSRVHDDILIDLPSLREASQRTVYTFLPGTDEAPVILTYAQLDKRARAIAAHLQEMGLSGKRALMLFPAGLDFLIAFFGCLYAGAIAVPVYPPRRGRSLERLHAVIDDCVPEIVLTTAAVHQTTQPMFAAVPELSRLPWLAVDTLDDTAADAWKRPALDAGKLAFLQYTSGSTGSPKGVMVSHGNLMHNLRMQHAAFHLSPDSIGVGWLPLFHDMGLIGMALQPLYVGFPMVMMPPAAFLQQPIRWIKAMSDFRATATGAPNFAFDLCTREITESQKAGLDLSHLEFVLTGAEPVRHETMERFARAFACCGFNRRAFRPSYGLAEATLLATTHDAPYVHVSANAQSAAEGRFEPCDPQAPQAQSLVGLGHAWLSQRIIIVNPDTNMICARDRIGEIWIAGESVAQGYWNQPEATAATFGARLANGDGPFLRTGDLGCFHEGQLYIAGRLKDLIIIGGKNHYPQDIEWTVDQLYADADAPPLQYGAAAAFGLPGEGGERLAIAVEVTRDWLRRARRGENPTAVDIIAAVRRGVAQEHEVQVHEVVLLKPGALPRTSSGKVRRRRCREAWLAGELEIAAPQNVQSGAAAVASMDLRAWLKDLCARLLNTPAEQIKPDRDLTQYGLDSISALRLAGELENRLARKIPPTLAWEYPSINAIAAFLDTTQIPASRRLIPPDPANIHQPFPLTEIQGAYWLGRSNAFMLGGNGCHFYAEFEGSGLDLARLSGAWESLVARHPMLRAVVQPDGTQRILEKTPPCPVVVVDLRGISAQERAEQLHKAREEMSHRVHDPAVWPLFELRAYRLSEDTQRLCLGIDLLIADVWSLFILLSEWEALYRGATFTPLELSFRDCVLAEARARDGTEYQTSLAYWKARVANLPDGPKLPLAKNPAQIGRARFVRREAELSRETWNALKERAHKAGLTPSMLVCAAFAEVIGAWSKEPRFTLNLTLFNRPPHHPQIDQVVGDFTSVLLLETDTRGSDDLAARAVRLQAQLRRDLEHSRVSGVEVLRLVNAHGAELKSMPVVFTSALGLPGTQTGNRAGHWLGRRVFSVSQTPQVWLDHQVMEQDGSLLLSWDAVEELFPAGVLDSMFETYLGLLRALSKDETVWGEAPLILTPPEHLRTWRQANATDAAAPSGLLHEALSRQAAIRGDAAAVISSRQSLSYRQLYLASNRIGRRLRALGAVPNTLVAIVMEKGCEQIASVMGILQAGAAYLPIDPALPRERIWTLLELGEAKIVLTQSWVDDRLEWPAHVTRLVLDRDDLSAESALPLEPAQAPSDLAYVIFTSGSTGTPKGVMIDHAGALNTVLDINRRFSVGPDDRVLAVSSLSFDLSVYDIFGTIAAGGALVIPDASQHNDPRHWAELMSGHRVTAWNSAPALMENLLEYISGTQPESLAALRLVMLSGDWIPLHVATQLKRLLPEAQVISLGGATEASIWSIFYPIEKIDSDWRSIPYGKPLCNQTFHVLDDKLAPRPAWVTGQLYIGGVGLALGYWKNPERTAAAFIQHPGTGERLYKTGDLGRYLPDGNIEFLGREDFQVKIQGHRIELGEIESVLNRHPAVMGSVVNVWNDNSGGKHLVAYLLPMLQVDRVAIDMPCTVKDEGGQEHALQAVNFSGTGMQLSGVPAAWVPGLRVEVSVQLPGDEGSCRLSGRLAWIKESKAGLSFDSKTSGRERLEQFLIQSPKAKAEEAIPVVTRFRYRTPDGRRKQIRVSLQQRGMILHRERAHDVEILDISSDGAQISRLPPEIAVGERFQLHVSLPPDGDVLWLGGTLIWRQDTTAGMAFNIASAEKAVLSQAIAHLVDRQGYWLNANNLSAMHEYLARSLPPYMVPRHYMLLPALPLNSNGKVDRRALPAPQQPAAESAAPRSAAEEKLARIWSEVLGVKTVGVRDNFFELGGYSQLAVRALLKIRECFQSDLPLRAFFESPTIEALAQRLERVGSSGAASIAQTQETGSLYGRYARRGIYNRIQVIHADKNYTSAQGLTLTYREDGRDRHVLDMVGGYGSTLLGHNHPELVKYARELLKDNMPAHAQHTDNLAAGELARKLSDKVGAYTGATYVTTLASTGTEAVEAAIKHAKQEFKTRAERQQATDDNLAALLLHQVKQGRLQLGEAAYQQAEAALGRALPRNPRALVEAIAEHNEKIYRHEPLFLALAHAFHGMTSGALSLTASNDFRAPFQWMGIRSTWISHRVRALQTAVQQEAHELLALDLGPTQQARVVTRPWHAIAGLFIEPIQGEGGIYPVTRTFATGARQVADKYGFPIIVDEIQCGMGRSGTFCAAEQLGLRGDYYVFSKSLGGGIAKISALLVDESRYQKDFGYYHGSTFAEDRPSCLIALKALEIMERDDVPARAVAAGERFMEKLRALRGRYPDVVADVRGRGLMIGLELASLKESDSFLLRVLSHGGMEILNYLVAGYLLNQHGVRIAPTKTRNTIRFLPSAYISEADMDRVVEALEKAFSIIQRANPGRLMRYIVDPDYDDAAPVADWRGQHPAWHDDVPRDEPRVAHIGHLENEAALLLAEPSMAEIPADKREELLRILFPISKVAIVQQLTVTAANGKKVHLSTIGLALTGELFEKMMRQPEDRELVLEKIDQAIELARRHDCRVIGFGGYTSIVSMNCTSVAATDLTLTSGNAYTTALGLEGLQREAKQRGLDLGQVTVGVVGAKGNIGSISARVLAEDSARFILFGRHAEDEGLLAVAHLLYQDAWERVAAGGVLRGLAHTLKELGEPVRRAAQAGVPMDAGARIHRALQDAMGSNAPVHISAEPSELARCELVVSATNSSQPVIFPEHLSRRTAVICDIATPADVSPRVPAECPWLTVISGGLARLPGEPGVNLMGANLPIDHVFGCVAETTLLGLIGHEGHFSFGEMNPQQVKFIAAIARDHGYEAGEVKRSAVPRSQG